MYCLLVYTTLLQLFISFDVTYTSSNSKISELPANKHKNVNAGNNNNNVKLYNVSRLLYSQPWRIIFNTILPMNPSGVYVLKIPLKQSNKTSMALNRCECWTGRDSRIFRKNKPLPKLKEDEIDFLRYHSYEKINNYLHSIQWKYPHIANVEEIGKSFEKRSINLIRLSAGEVGTKAMILITGGMNGNEWISSATVLYAIQQLVENSVNSYMLEKADWYIIPLMNPDGYVYSRNHDHNWKNTLSCRTNHTSSNNACSGVDLNKNFDFNCNHSDFLQAASNYSGQYPFSEPEAIALSDFLTKRYQVHLYLNINDYGQSIDYPLSTYAKQHTDDVKDLKFLAEKASEAVYKYGGYKYAVRGFNSCGSEQWARRLGIKYVYNIKLGTKSRIPESEVFPVAQNVFVAIRQFEQIIVSIYSVIYDLIDDD